MRSTSHGKKRPDWLPFLMLLPALILLLAITVYPFITSASLSFTDYNFLKQDTKFVGFKNYFDIIAEGKFLSSVGFTFFWTCINVIGMIVLGFVVALLLRGKFIGQKFLKGTMLIPWVLPQVVTGYIFSLLLSTDVGALNILLQQIGVLPEGFSWFSTPAPATAAVFIANIWRGFPFVSLMLYAKMQSIPISYLEAASIDGANGRQSFLYIMFSFLRPVAATCMFLTFLWSFNAFDIIKVMTDGGPLGFTTTLSLQLQKEAFSYLEISRACTMAVIMFLLLIACVCIFLLLRKIWKRLRNID